MNSLLEKIIKWPSRKMSFGKDFVKRSGSIIPSTGRRWCGPEFSNDDFYIKSAEYEAKRLINKLGCTSESHVLDVGCGQGRLPIGILRIIGNIRYIGIDVDAKSIDWCKKYIEKHHKSFNFLHINVYNERYNKKGHKIEKSFDFGLKKKTIDIVYLFSVFSHTSDHDLKIYLRSFNELLKRNGKIFFTAFVEDNVENISINPKDYRMKCSGPLHIVRYKKEYLFNILNESGFDIIDFTSATEADRQSGIYLQKKTTF